MLCREIFHISRGDVPQRNLVLFAGNRQSLPGESHRLCLLGGCLLVVLLLCCPLQPFPHLWGQTLHSWKLSRSRVLCIVNLGKKGFRCDKFLGHTLL